MNRSRQSGVALVMVMMALALAVVLGLSYVSSASVRLASSQNMVVGLQAQYVAESGLDYGAFLLQTNPSQITNTSAGNKLTVYAGANNTLPAYVYATAVAGQPGQYVLTSDSTTGGVKHTSGMKVQVGGAPTMQFNRSLMIGSANGQPKVTLPFSVAISGPVYVNATLVDNLAVISNGNLYGTGTIRDDLHRIQNGTTVHVNTPEQMPTLTTANYRNYSMYGTSYSAPSIRGKKIRPRNLNQNDTAIDPTVVDPATNPVGVLEIVTLNRNQPVELMTSVAFQGTIIVDGDVIIHDNVTLTALPNMPALVVNGTIYFQGDTNVTINGYVISTNGIVDNGTGNNTKSTINGGVISTNPSYGASIKGTHKLNYDASKSVLYDFGNNASSKTVTVLSTSG